MTFGFSYYCFLIAISYQNLFNHLKKNLLKQDWQDFQSHTLRNEWQILQNDNSVGTFGWIFDLTLKYLMTHSNQVSTHLILAHFFTTLHQHTVEQ